jgi:hypothetical protein
MMRLEMVCQVRMQAGNSHQSMQVLGIGLGFHLHFPGSEFMVILTQIRVQHPTFNPFNLTSQVSVRALRLT